MGSSMYMKLSNLHSRNINKRTIKVRIVRLHKQPVLKKPEEIGKRNYTQIVAAIKRKRKGDDRYEKDEEIKIFHEYHLFSTPEFKKLHLGQFSSDPIYQSFILHSFNKFSIFNIESGKKSPTILAHPFTRAGKKRPTILDHPFTRAQTIEPYTVGCCNGLVCIRSGQNIVLWNPAMKLSKTFPLKDCGLFKMVSLGFGYDAIGDDFKVVMIVTNLHGEVENDTSVEIYSANLDSWTTIDVGFQFSWFKVKSDMTVNGNPYWVARIDGNETLLCFDVLELVFKIVPKPNKTDLDGLDGYTKTGKETYLDLGDWNGALGALIINYEVEYRNGSSRIGCVWVLVFDDIEQIWRKIHTFGPIEVDVYRGRDLLFTRNAKILGFYTLTNCVC
ncbi:hypothetical protein CASFOL_013224 [Castilleja foliolosa]|uniref:F-box associated beta-propeller type 1 domain-containing protein n=1 Tax=Castilleja foliolosa TaxID=1961234 RepID=A0ABD3DMZ6_9LAMI